MRRSATNTMPLWPTVVTCFTPIRVYNHLKTTFRTPIWRTRAHGVYMSTANHRTVKSRPHRVLSGCTNGQLPRHSLADMRALAERPNCLLHATAVGSWAKTSARPLQSRRARVFAQVPRSITRGRAPLCWMRPETRMWTTG